MWRSSFSAKKGVIPFKRRAGNAFSFSNIRETPKNKVIRKTLGFRIPETQSQQRLVYMSEADLDKIFGKVEEDGEENTKEKDGVTKLSKTTTETMESAEEDPQSGQEVEADCPVVELAKSV